MNDIKNYKYTAIIPASGRGTRMGSSIPKQYLPLNGKPVLYYVLKAFEDSDVDEIILVVTAGEEEYVKENYVKAFGFNKVTKIVPGGAERYLSVYEGLKAATDADYVLIHDAARPLVEQKLIQASMEAVVKYGACVPAVPVADTIKVRGEDGAALETLDRNSLAAIQTPQCFKRELLLRGYEAVFAGKDAQNIDAKRITDDASVVEIGLGEKVILISGDSRNRKLTTPEDVIFAEALMQKEDTKKQ